MKKVLAISLCLILTACGGGGGGGSDPAPVTQQSATTQQAGPADTVLLTAGIAIGLDPWFHTQQTAADGSETLVLSTIDGANIRNTSAPTPLYIIKADDTGVTDVTSQFFDSVPKTFWSRNLISFKDDSGAQALYVCNQGRETTMPSSANGADGVWAEQDQMLVMRNGKYSDATTSMISRSIDFTHGCAIANLGDGKAGLVKNRFGMATPTKSLMTFNGTYYAETANLDTVYTGGETKGTFAVAAADFTKTGTDDVVFGTAVIRKTGSTYATAYTIAPPPDYAAAGYSIIHNLVTADLNGDGYPDLIVTYSGNGDVTGGPSFLVGAKIAVYLNDKSGNLVYKANAIPSTDETEFGLTLRAMDINFDGKLDVVTSGSRYIYSNLTQPTDSTVRSVLINNGDGTFIKKTLNDAALSKQCSIECQTQTFYLKNADSSFNIVSYGKNSAGQHFLYGRKVTQDMPLTLQ